jgi:hypothetical protein
VTRSVQSSFEIGPGKKWKSKSDPSSARKMRVPLSG